MELKKEELEKASGDYDIYTDENGRYLKFSGKDKNLKYVLWKVFIYVKLTAGYWKSPHYYEEISLNHFT